MKISHDVRSALIVSAVACVLSACSSGGSQQVASQVPATTRNNAAIKTTIPAPAANIVAVARPRHGKSWISPDARRAPRLLFISDYGASEVFILTMPAMALKGTLTGFDFPEGACSDASGNIWIANTGEQELLKYSRTGTLLATLSDPGEYPSSCAVNYKTGDLAVTNIENSSAAAGNVVVYKNATGTGTPYQNAAIFEYFFAGYDPSGNLFFDGTDSSRTASYLAELPAGSSNTKLITLSGATLGLAGFIQWYRNGNYLALGDQACGGTTSSCVYWVAVSGSTGTVTGTTNLTNYEGGNVCDLVQGVIAGNGERYLAGPDYEYCGYTPTTADRWPWDAGGSPTNYNNSAPFVEPIGAAVSTK